MKNAVLFIRDIFWNPAESRIRSLWRLILTVLLMAVLVGTSQVAVAGFANNITSGNVVFLAVLTLIITAAIVLSVYLAGLSLDRRPFRSFGLHFSRRWWIDFAFGIALGAVLMLLIFLIELAAGWITVTGFFQSISNFGGDIAAFIIFTLCIAIQEELFNRGYLIVNLAEGFNSKRIGSRRALLAAFLLSSAIFGVLHIFNPNASATSSVSVAIAGMLLGLGFILTGDLAIPIGLHLSWNFFQGNVFGFPVSGQNMGATFIAIEQGGPVWLTGGAFGPEAGALGLLAILGGMAAIFAWLRWRYGAAVLRTDLAEYGSDESTGKA